MGPGALTLQKGWERCHFLVLHPNEGLGVWVNPAGPGDVGQKPGWESEAPPVDPALSSPCPGRPRIHVATGQQLEVRSFMDCFMWLMYHQPPDVRSTAFSPQRSRPWALSGLGVRDLKLGPQAASLALLGIIGP